MAQDIIVMKNGDEIKAKIIEVKPDVISYKKWESKNGPTYSEYKNKVFMVKYEDGTKDIFSSEQEPIKDNTSAEDTRKSVAIDKLQKYFNAKLDAKHPLKVISFNKTNGIMREINGQPVYEIQFDLILQFKVDGWVVGNHLDPGGFWKPGFNVATKQPTLGAFEMAVAEYFPQGTTIKFGCTANMESTDNGYQLKNYVIRTNKKIDAQSIVIDEPINKTPVAIDLSTYIEMENETYYVSLQDIQVSDELSNTSEVQATIINILSGSKRFSANSARPITDTLYATSMVSFSYGSPIIDTKLFTSDCDVEIVFTSKKSGNVLYKNSYHKTGNSAGFSSKLAAERAIIATDLKQIFYQFIVGNFPISGEITEVIEKSRKQDEAKIVKINVGSNHGVSESFRFYLKDSEKQAEYDVVVQKVFEDHSICKVNNSQKKILDLTTANQKIKVETRYKPAFLAN
ncbi:MAG TPA: hypothetical protein VEB40_07540 [Flavipsychrobacter sp.]|nr:hypothetical protein [Flavipsychrobacter sp.]